MRCGLLGHLVMMVGMMVGCGGSDTKPLDLSVGLPDGFGSNTCAIVVMCENACVDKICVAACDDQASLVAAPLVVALHACVDLVCPEVPEGSDLATSPCEYDPTNGKFSDAEACSQCVSAAQAPGGACSSAVSACAANT